MHFPWAGNQLRYLRHSALPGVELLCAHHSLEKWRMFHQRYLICGCTSAASSWVYRRKTQLIEDGMTALMEPGEVHRVVAKHKPSSFLGLFLEPYRLQEFCQEMNFAGMPHFRVAQIANPRLLAQLSRFSRALEDGDDNLKVQSLLTVAVYEALKNAEFRPAARKAGGPGGVQTLGRVRQMLEERYNEAVTLEELASATALSRYHLVRSFTRHFGLPPHAYLIQVRIKRACVLLRSGMPSVEVAPSVGFADQSHFTRHFKKIIGVTPSQYARSKFPQPLLIG